MKKRNHRQQQYQTIGYKILSATFPQTGRSNFAAGDQNNNLIYYSILSNKPITILNNNSSNPSSITALTFIKSDTQILAGSNRGSMNVWDLNTQKISYILKGHTVEICQFYQDGKNPHIIASGSYDTHGKIWDLRSKHCQQTVKGHKMKVSALRFTNDSKTLITGGEDGILQNWDLRMSKIMNQNEIQSGILSIDINGGLVVAGCADRIARIYNLNSPQKIICCTKNDSMPITCVNFYKNDILFTAGSDIFKAWNIKEDIFLADNIETSSKGILDMLIDDFTMQIAFYNGCLSYHKCQISQINFNTPFNAQKQIYSQQRIQVRNNSGTKDQNKHLSHEKGKKIIVRKNESLVRKMADLNEQVNDVLKNVKNASYQFNKRKNESIQLSDLFQGEHSKFMKAMSSRLLNVEIIQQFWIKNNLKQVINNIKIVDIHTANDVFAQMVKQNKISMSVELGILMIQKSEEMIKTSNSVLIKSGLGYISHIIQLFKEPILKNKGTDDMEFNKQKIRVYDRLIELYQQIYKSTRLKHFLLKKDQIGQLSEHLIQSLSQFFTKLSRYQSI